MSGTRHLSEAFEVLKCDPEVQPHVVDVDGCTVDWSNSTGDAVEISLVTFDSREVVHGTLFLCKGATFKREYLESAVQAGAVAYVADKAYEGVGVPGIVVSNIMRAQALLANWYFGNPSQELDVVGITGTKGKTTTAYYIDSMLRSRQGKKNALVTGLVIDDGASRQLSTHNTTPEALVLQGVFRRSVSSGCDAAVMEASSQGLKVDRTFGVRFAVGVFINIGEDHVSPIEHPTLEDYFQSKLKIFAQSETAVVNLETQRVDEVLAAAQASKRIITYSSRIGDAADVQLKVADHLGEGRWHLVIGSLSGDVEFDFCALGRFNISNACAAIAVGEALGVSREAMVAGLSQVKVPGRAERYDVPDGSIVGIIDYAHNGISLEALLRDMREEFPSRELTVVFGAIGHKAFERRSGLGKAAGMYADKIVLTEDDPGPARVEDIAEEVGRYIREQGNDYIVIPDRVTAVKYAIANAVPPAVVVLAGKGTEDTILRKGVWDPIDPDAKQFCDAVGLKFEGYADALGV